MARNYQSNKHKRTSKSKDVRERGKTTVRHHEMDEKEREHLMHWVTYYRRNMHRFVEHYMGVELYFYQRIWIYLISQSTRFLGIASRASAKSWIIAVYSVARCILYPNTTISLSSSTKSQAGLIISVGVKGLYDDHVVLQQEIIKITTNMNEYSATFRNGSIIEVVISGESGRGHRSNITVLEERRLIPTEIIDSIIRPFLVARQAPYMKKKEYMGLPPEEPQEIIISSAYYKSHEWYPEAKKLLKMIAEGDPDVKGLFLDYLISIKHNIKTKKSMAKEKATMDAISFSMEYGNIPFGGSSSSFYKLGFFKRKIKRPWLPRRLGADGIGKNAYDIKRKTGERRLVAMDIAARAGSTNDNTIFTLARLFPSNRGYLTELSYIESWNGENTVSQALRAKQLYAEFSGYHPDDALILDIANVGIGVYDNLTQITHDDERDVDYDAMTVMEHDSISEKTYKDLSKRCLTKDAQPCIYPISGSAQLNSDIASALRNRLKKNLISFLLDENQQEEYFIKKGNLEILDQEDLTIKAFLLSANIQTTLLINECISLEMSMTGGGQLVKLEEPSGGRKDRYSSVSYLNWYVSLIEGELLKEEDEEDDLEAWLGALAVV